jgi:coniferyl-aldehyde dehydrogenase
MSILETDAPPVAAQTQEDVAAIATLHAAFAVQRDAFAKNRLPSITERRERIGALQGMLLTNRKAIGEALASDFGAHPVPASDLIEVLGPLGRAQYVLDNLEEWMRPMSRQTDEAVMGTASAHIQSQPKGVVGNMVPWNFPFDIAVGPMIEMLAAGNRVMVKPSEYTPASAVLLAQMVREAFDPDLVYVAVGGLELARAFSKLPFDHLLYTGSPNVGRQVMAAAAGNLTPVTLELGGKCPVVMAPGSVTPANVEAVIGTKVVKNGQMCISADHCFVPKDEVENFATLARAFMDEASPGYASGPDCTGIISPRHLDRLTEMLNEARERQSRIVPLEDEGEIDRTTRRMPMFLVIDPAPDLRIMQEEIFGPILPVIPYEAIDDVIENINAGERPLGVYVFSDDQTLVDHVLAETNSGGAAVNTCAVQGALPSLAFGGVGMSGMGRHHGVEGFREFSNQRGIVVRGKNDHISAFYAPYTKAAALVESALGPG